MRITRLRRLFGLCALLLGLSACGNGGSINFMDQPSTTPSTTGSADFSLVPASQALAIESGKTTANGYHAKLQLNPLKGQALTAPGGYAATVKFTKRNQ